MSQTTIRIDDELLAEAKAFAARQHRSLNSVVEDALRQILRRHEMAKERPRVELPVFSGEPGFQPWVDPSLDIKHITDELDTQDFVEGFRRNDAP
ncbi:MAG: DUF2191 domain-containing protein [Streptosporangiales bacterium]|nr:DUF2191 domain-containing protein [Streptosporangiales bacterium]